MLLIRLALLALIACGQSRLEVVENPPMEPCGTVPQGVPTTFRPAPEAISDTTVYSLMKSGGSDCCCVAFGDPMRLLMGVGEGPGPDAAHPYGYGPVYHRALVKLDGIPDGDLVAWRLLLTQESALSAGTVDIFRVSDANEWGEPGPASELGPQAGAADWFHRSHPVSWDGLGAELGPPGVDGPGASFEYGPQHDGMTHVVALPVEWLLAWRDGSRVNNGVFLQGRAPSSPQVRNLLTAHSSEAEHTLSFEVDIAQE